MGEKEGVLLITRLSCLLPSRINSPTDLWTPILINCVFSSRFPDTGVRTNTEKYYEVPGNTGQYQAVPELKESTMFYHAALNSTKQY